MKDNPITNYNSQRTSRVMMTHVKRIFTKVAKQLRQKLARLFLERWKTNVSLLVCNPTLVYINISIIYDELNSLLLKLSHLKHLNIVLPVVHEEFIAKVFNIMSC